MTKPWEKYAESPAAGGAPWEKYQYVPNNATGGSESVYDADSGETYTASAGTSALFSSIQADDVFDHPDHATVGEEMAAVFQAQSSYLGLSLVAAGVKSPTELADFIADNKKALAYAQQRQPEYMDQFNREFRESRGVFGKTFATIKNIRGVGRMVLTNSANAAMPLVSGAAGLAAGAPAGPPGMAAGGAVGSFIGGVGVEVGSELDELLGERGYDTSKADDLRRLAADKETLNELRAYANKKGVTTAAFDAVMTVVTGGIFRVLKPVTKTGKALVGTAAVVTEGVGEGLGEAAGQKVAYGAVDADEAILEGIAGLVQSGGQAALFGGAAMATQARADTASNKLEAASEAGSLTDAESAQIQAVESELTQQYSDFLDDVEEASPDFVGKRPSAIAEFASQLGVETEKTVTPISTRIFNISEKLGYKMRRFEVDTMRSVLLDTETIKPLARLMKGMSQEDKLTLDLAMKNADSEKISALSSKYGAGRAVDDVRQMLDDLYNKSKEAGINVDYLEEFFPRKVRDVNKLVDHLMQREGYRTVITEAFDKAQQRAAMTEESKAAVKAYRAKLTSEIKAGEKRQLTPDEVADRREKVEKFKKTQARSELTQAQKEDIINRLLLGRKVNGVSLADKGVFKGRAIDIIDEDINQYYYSSIEALLSYVHTANESIETNKLFGKTKASPKAEMSTEDSVGAMVYDLVENGEISNVQAEQLRDMLNARFNPGRMGEWTAAVRDVSYITVMGSPLNAITQVGDLAPSMYNAGVFRTLAALPGAITDKSKITIEDMGLNKISQEFDNENVTSRGVDLVFLSSGLTKIDRIGKLTFLNSAMSKYMDQAKSRDSVFLKQLEAMFGGDAESVRQKIEDGVVDDDVRLVLFNRLSDIQPISRLEMPERYNKAGFNKLFYMLKSFTIKKFDFYRREIYSEMYKAAKTGDKARAAKAVANFVRLTGFWIMMDASADWIKDYVRSFFDGEDMRDPEDYVTENVLSTLVPVTKYQADLVGREGVGEAVKGAIFPPTKLPDDVSKDAAKFAKGELTLENMRSIRSVPIGGELYWFWFGGGSYKTDGNGNWSLSGDGYY